ncbi:hypothetical protein KY312_02940 [Candidatus Woesearchaeota archaeon]|nr:hypothetical protein [Candidatus Woesearchaeota archaeon]
MKGEFFIEYPNGIDESGFLRYKIMYQGSEKEEPLVASEHNVPTQGLGERLDRILDSSASSAYYKAVAANIGLRRISSLRYMFGVDLKVLLEKAYAIGEPVIEGKQPEIFANALAQAKTNMGELYKLAEKKKETQVIQMPRQEVNTIDLSNESERNSQTKRFFGDSFDSN